MLRKTVCKTRDSVVLLSNIVSKTVSDILSTTAELDSEIYKVLHEYETEVLEDFDTGFSAKLFSSLQSTVLATLDPANSNSLSISVEFGELTTFGKLKKILRKSGGFTWIIAIAVELFVFTILNYISLEDCKLGIFEASIMDTYRTAFPVKSLEALGVSWAQNFAKYLGDFLDVQLAPRTCTGTTASARWLRNIMYGDFVTTTIIMVALVWIAQRFLPMLFREQRALPQRGRSPTRGQRGPKIEPIDACQRCDKKSTAVCSSCGRVGYCSVACQTADWSEHQSHCV
jgi:hypothetical protein